MESAESSEMPDVAEDVADDEVTESKKRVTSYDRHCDDDDDRMSVSEDKQSNDNDDDDVSESDSE